MGLTFRAWTRCEPRASLRSTGVADLKAHVDRVKGKLLADPVHSLIWASPWLGLSDFLRYGAAEPVLEMRRADARVVARGEGLIV
jgi:hypothetical protein